MGCRPDPYSGCMADWLNRGGTVSALEAAGWERLHPSTTAWWTKPGGTSAHPARYNFGGADRIQSQAPAAVEVEVEPPRRTRKRRTATTSSLLGRVREGP